jgi:cytochrome c5
MSNTSNTPVHEAAHAGPVGFSRQSVVTALFSLVMPIVVVASLVYSVMSPRQLADSTANLESAVSSRIQKVGRVEFRVANREARTGEQVFAAQCTNCHKAGIAGAPKFGDAAAWGPRIQTGFDALLNSALKGKNAMGAQGGGEFDDFEIARAVVYMANAGGAKFAEPVKAAAPAK